MNAVFRHLGVRLWLTALVGTLACVYLLPLWQQYLGVERLVIPAFVIMMIFFVAVGWGMNRIGLGVLKQHIDEAAVWERAGMMAEAESAIQKAMADFDSLWLSPLLRRGRLQWFSKLMARFYLARHSERPFVRSLIAVHLTYFPQDKEVAEPWLEQLFAFEDHFPIEHEAAASVGEHLVQHRRIQRLLMQFYMVNGRIDFNALQTYRRVWNAQQPLSDNTLHELAKLLRNGYFLSHWALQVYLKAYERGDAASIEGIAAALKWLPDTEESRPYLKNAQTMIAQLESQKSASLDSRYRPALIRPPSKEKTLLNKRPSHAPYKSSTGLISSTLKKSKKSVAGLIGLFYGRRYVQYALPAFAIVLILVAGGIAGRYFFSSSITKPTIRAQAVVVKEPIINAPFTIQVAAYLRSEDAKWFVDKLVEKKLDAFWTKATSANRTWYQVKVSHFNDRDGAQKYGRELKSKGLIDDFYVANYDEHKHRKNPK